MLMADRYNDDEPGQKAAAALPTDQPATTQHHPTEVKHEVADDDAQDHDYNGDIQMNNDEYEDDDDDVDFNLGNGPATVVSHHEEKPSIHTLQSAPPPPPPPTKGPNAKEDG